jgi:hypothetical protein
MKHRIGYTKAWVAAGVVDDADLASDDPNGEHARAAAFVAFLGRCTQLSDAQVDQLVALSDEGDDGCDLCPHRLIELIACGTLTDAQHFALSARHPQVLEPPVAKRYLREGLRRKIAATGLEANFAELQQQGDAAIQLLMLDHPELTRSQGEWLARAGANKAIRNRAAQFLAGSRAQTPPKSRTRR